MFGGHVGIYEPTHDATRISSSWSPISGGNSTTEPFRSAHATIAAALWLHGALMRWPAGQVQDVPRSNARTM